MRRRPALVLLLVAAGTALAVALAGARTRAAERELAAERARLDRLTQRVQRAVDLAARAERVAIGQRPQSDVLGRVQTALREAQVPVSRLQRLAQSADTALDRRGSRQGPQRRRQSYRLTLGPVTPAELGRFLAAWRHGQSLWRVSRLELSHQRGAANDYAATIVVSATYLAPHEDPHEDQPTRPGAGP